MTPIELLDIAERLIRTEGWSRTKMNEGLLGRLYQAAGFRFGHATEKDQPVLHAAANAVRKFLGVQHLSIWDYNNERTVDDVLAAIDGARKLLTP